MSQTSSLIKNPHLDGGPFVLEGGRVGVLLIHGYTATTAEVRPLAERLHAKGYTVSAPLLPGHNTHPKDANRFTWKDWVASIEAAYRELAINCDQVFLGGESTGGLLALYLGSYHPEIAGLLTYAPALELTLRPIDVLMVYLAAPFIPYIYKQQKEDELPWKGYIVSPLKGTLQLLNLQRQVCPGLINIRRPILIVQGRLDNTVKPEVPGLIYNKVRSVIKEIHWLENSSHCVVLDLELDQVAAITLQFIERVIS
jgi:carboxylesterase